MRKYLLILLFITSKLYAQPYFDLANASYSYQYESPVYKGKDELKTENDYRTANLNFPLQISKRFLLLPTFTYEGHQFHLNDSQNENFQQNDLAFGTGNKITTHSICFPLGFQYTLHDSTKKFAGALIYRFNYIGNAGAGSQNDMIGGALIYSKTKSEHLTLSAGLYYNREFYGNYFLPLLGADWQISERLFVWGLLPSSANLDYSFSKAIHGGLTFKGIEDSYHGYTDKSYFYYYEPQLKIFGEFYIPRSQIVLRLECGQSFMRKLKYSQTEDGTEIKNSVSPVETSILLAGISYRFATNKNFRTPLKPPH